MAKVLLVIYLLAIAAVSRNKHAFRNGSSSFPCSVKFVSLVAACLLGRTAPVEAIIPIPILPMGPGTANMLGTPLLLAILYIQNKSQKDVGDAAMELDVINSTDRRYSDISRFPAFDLAALTPPEPENAANTARIDDSGNPTPELVTQSTLQPQDLVNSTSGPVTQSSIELQDVEKTTRVDDSDADVTLAHEA